MTEPKILTIGDRTFAKSSIKISKVWAMPNRWTFKIPIIKKLLEKYVGTGQGWVDPFAGKYSPAEFTNDLNPEMPTTCHLEAENFCESLHGEFNGVLFDPPYSYHQIKECYQSLGLPTSRKEISPAFYARVIDAIIPKMKIGSLAICFGFNSQGFGKNRGFEPIEIVLIAHGAHHNDTIVVVEKKVQALLDGERNDHR